MNKNITTTIIIVIALSIEYAKNRPETVIIGAGNTNWININTDWPIKVISLVLLVIIDAVPILLKSFIDKSCDFINTASLISLQNPDERFADTLQTNTADKAVIPATIIIIKPVFTI